MSWTQFKQSTRTGIFAGAVISLAALGLWIGAENNSAGANSKAVVSDAVPSATFTGVGTGPIPDGGTGCSPSPGAPRNVTFDVTGIGTAPTNVSIGMTFGGPAHTFVGDIVATLIAPNGASHLLFGRTGATTASAFGSGADLVGPYTFNDAAAGTNWWTAASLATIASGTYRTTPSGGAGVINPPTPTSMNPAFAGIPTSNGTWTLRLTDGCSQDTGA
jgi:hypothetical protein